MPVFWVINWGIKRSTNKRKTGDGNLSPVWVLDGPMVTPDRGAWVQGAQQVGRHKNRPVSFTQSLLPHVQPQSSRSSLF